MVLIPMAYTEVLSAPTENHFGLLPDSSFSFGKAIKEARQSPENERLLKKSLFEFAVQLNKEL